ncbi:hypothetical protein [Laspinema palackyanum]|uniref:hypothetical protein n=1 Tax=Laspinema palackyanum TaxID=3231601 RepID=UPI00345D088A|nr:hypothetical protein [Laspinema sp. D2c]
MLHYCSESPRRFKYWGRVGAIGGGRRSHYVSRSLTKIHIGGKSVLVNKLQ